MKKKGSKKNLIILGSIVFTLILIGSIFTIKYIKSTIIDNLDFEIIAEKSTDAGIETKTDFVITAGKNYAVNALKNAISLQPAVDFSLDKVSNGKYLLTPKEELKDNSLYNIYIKDTESKPTLSWAFQTKTNFNVSSSMPMDKSTYVNLNTGIEIHFSKPVKDITEYFEILPKTDGKFEYEDKKVIFIPTSLNANTPYRVTVKKGLKNVYGEQLEEDYSFVFRTEKGSEDYFYLQNNFGESFITSESPKISISCGENYKNSIFNVNIYKLTGVQEYVNFLQIHDNEVNDDVGESTDYNFDMSKHFLEMNFQAGLENGSDDWQWIYDLKLPKKLDAGWYIADVTTEYGNLHFQKAIQVSDISFYTFGLKNEVEIWCNDSENGETISGATVQVGDLAAVTNKDGLAFFNINEDKKQKVFVTSKDGKEFGEYISFSSIDNKSLSDNYYMYMYTDRMKYFPTDTIKFWGAIIPRNTNTAMPKEVTVRFNLQEVKIPVNENGIFIGSFNISNYNSTWIGIELDVDGMSRFARGIEISDYTKPVYKISSTFSKEYYKSNEAIDLNISGKFYDGTSAENLQLKVSYGNNEYNTVTLDSNGEARTVIKPYTYKNSGETEYVYADLQVVGIDEYASAYNNTTYFPTDYYLGTEWDSVAQKLKFNTNMVNYDAVKNGIVDYERIHTGESFAQKVNVQIVKTERVKKQTGETYNYYTDMVEPTYIYENKEEIIDNFEVNIEKDKNYFMDLPYVEDDDISYRAECYFTLPDGYAGNRTVYLYKNVFYGGNKYYFSRDYKSLKTNENTTLTLKSRTGELGNARLLYFVSNDKINKLGVTNQNTVEVKMEASLIPNCLISAVVFDGRELYEVNSENIYFDSEEKELGIEITTNKEAYKPGETVTAKFLVKDKTGKPISTDLLISVTDEATLVNSQEYNPLNLLYEARQHYPKIFISNAYNDLDGGDGGGGGEDARDTFANVLKFDNLTTNGNGEAECEFTMSDDLTSWRITAIAISKDVKSGIKTKNISTSIPFFINQVINTKYTINDDFTFSARVSGNIVKLLSSMVEYEAKIENGETKRLQLKPGDTAMFNFGKLKTGKYKITLIAKSGNYSDAITKEIEVIDSLSEVSLTKELDIDEIGKLNVTRYPAKLILFDKNNSLYYKALKKILEQCNGGTNEQIFARNFANTKLNEFYGSDIWPVKSEFAPQGYTGGISKYPYSEPSPLITAKVAMLSPELLNIDEAKRYFYEIIENSASLPNEVTSAYMGLAALKEPVLNDIKYLLNNDRGLELIDKINLITALAYIGDYSSANTYYEKEISGILNTANEYKYISEQYETRVYQATSQICGALALLRHKDFEPVLKYVIDNTGKDYISSLDLAIYVSSYNPKSESESLITYEISGKKDKVDFSKDSVKILQLTEEELSSFKVVKYKGNISAIAEYTGGIKDLTDIGDEVKIKKTISKGTLGGYSTVTLNVSGIKNDEYYGITDFIPASSRYATDDRSAYNPEITLTGYEKQKVKFNIHAGQTNKCTITYKIRNVLSGEYLSEGAVIADENGNIIGKSDDIKVTIK